jgi:hypothetical protein
VALPTRISQLVEPLSYFIYGMIDVFFFKGKFFSMFDPSTTIFGPPLLKLALQPKMRFNFRLVLGIPLSKLFSIYFMRLGAFMACLRTRMVTSTIITSWCCIFLMLICYAVVPTFPILWGFTFNFLQGLHLNDIFFPRLPSFLETLDVHIFLKSNMFGACESNIL